MAIALRQTRLIPSAMSFAAYLAAVDELEGAMALLDGETQGFAIDATTDPPTVAVIDTGTPANNLDNVTLDASNLTQSSTSPKMVHWPSSPYVRWTPHNLFLNSGAPVTQNVTLVTGFVYTFGITGAGTLTGSSGASGAATAGNPVTFTATGTTGTFTVSGGTPTTMQINRGPILTTYLTTTGAIRIGIPQSYDAAASRYGILVEPAATNVILRSEEFNNASWTKVQASITADDITAPDSSNTADKFQYNTNSSDHNVVQLFTGTADAWTHSVYAKAGEQLRVDLTLYNGTTYVAEAVFNLSDGTIVSNVIGSGATILSVGDDWYRCSVTATLAASAGCEAAIFHVQNGTTTTNFAGANTTDGLYIWGDQVELGTVATSYVPTVGAVAVRAVDSITVAGSSIPYSTTEATLYADVKSLLVPDTTDPSICEISADTNNRFGIRQDDANPIQYNIDGGASDTSDFGTLVADTRTQLSTAFAANDHDASQDGATVVSDTLGTHDSTAAASMTIRIGGTVSNAAVYFNGYIYRLVHVPRQVETEDGDLEAWKYEA